MLIDLKLLILLGNERLVGDLARAGADVNAQQIDGWTALHFSAIDGEKDCDFNELKIGYGCI